MAPQLLIVVWCYCAHNVLCGVCVWVRMAPVYEAKATMVDLLQERKGPFGLAVSGEAESWLPALEQIVGPRFLTTYKVTRERDLFDVVQAGLVQAAVLDEAIDWRVDVLHLLRMIHRLDAALPVVVLTTRTDRRYLEDALRLAVFSVVVKPLELEELLFQIQRMMVRLDAMFRGR